MRARASFAVVAVLAVVAAGCTGSGDEGSGGSSADGAAAAAALYCPDYTEVSCPRQVAVVGLPLTGRHPPVRGQHEHRERLLSS